ncbi:Txe/YoeB family addiction module toxin [Lelliottia amnigena]|uniref:Putative mRNA interferase YoeB n=1 Tax=Lelliottia amnigena TaxID=61646 RepID=A0AAP2AJA4_LELAM|nr:Txe/YoeB family addiction module toxin [Lelliottia amnigena]MBL5901723.1 Txe/YoeB family addiction module toxin [Lelliottia amnigena]MBL5937236.1 Txe/YoeB family addiction module toxin [Lelliottia amnigena]
MKVHRSPQARADLAYWEENDPKIKARIDAIIESIKADYFKGLGKPEPLKYQRPLWSRRITKEHRFVYFVKDDELFIVACRFHYTTI